MDVVTFFCISKTWTKTHQKLYAYSVLHVRFLKARNRISFLRVCAWCVQTEQQNRLEIMDGFFSLCSQILSFSPSLTHYCIALYGCTFFWISDDKGEKKINQNRKYDFHAHTSGLYYDLFERRMFETL